MKTLILKFAVSNRMLFKKIINILFTIILVSSVIISVLIVMNYLCLLWLTAIVTVAIGIGNFSNYILRQIPHHSIDITNIVYYSSLDVVTVYGINPINGKSYSKEIDKDVKVDTSKPMFLDDEWDQI